MPTVTQDKPNPVRRRDPSRRSTNVTPVRALVLDQMRSVASVARLTFDSDGGRRTCGDILPRGDLRRLSLRSWAKDRDAPIRFGPKWRRGFGLLDIAIFQGPIEGIGTETN
jgi:hypothetical protein